MPNLDSVFMFVKIKFRSLHKRFIFNEHSVLFIIKFNLCLNAKNTSATESYALDTNKGVMSLNAFCMTPIVVCL
ncbi:hypothetical protein D3A96_12060 [Robertkochia marina]|nr:hypothetical protein D3A96_12060 [Robertkochia marina]